MIISNKQANKAVKPLRRSQAKNITAKLKRIGETKSLIYD
jgi:hypothetical protein